MPPAKSISDDKSAPDESAKKKPAAVEKPVELTLDTIFASKTFRAENYSQPRWWREGSCYTTLGSDAKEDEDKDDSSEEPVEKKARGADGAKVKDTSSKQSSSASKSILWHDPSNQSVKTYVPSDLLIPPGSDQPLTIDDYFISPDKSHVLIFTNSKKVWRKKTRGDYWILDVSARELRQVGVGPGGTSVGDGKTSLKPSTLMFATFSPDGKKVAYVRANNIYVEDLYTCCITQLTTDGSHAVINGNFDWVYEEEFSLFSGFRWSPDSTSIAYWRLDQSGVKVYSLVNNSQHMYPVVKPIPYPKCGEMNSECKVGVVSVAQTLEGDERKTIWLDVSGDPRDHYIASLDWVESISALSETSSPGKTEIVLQQFNRLQNTVKVIVADPLTGQTDTIFIDRDDAWLDLQRIRFLSSTGASTSTTSEDGYEKSKRYWSGNFLFLSERNGFRQIFSVDRQSGEATALTLPKYDVIEISGVDEKDGWVYFIASPSDPLRRYLYRAKLNGEANYDAERVTPLDLSGTNNYRISPGCKFAIHGHSSFDSPETYCIVSLPEHDVRETLADNVKIRETLEQIPDLPQVEFLRVDIGDGIELDAYCLKPSSFEPTKKYPVLFYVYGEPAMCVVRDAWGGKSGLFHRMLAQKGYIILCVDNRGTPAPRGRAWRKIIYRRIGIIAPADQAAALRSLLASRPYLDPERIAIWGWSGGGSMSLNVLFRYPEMYQTAMAVAPVPNQRHYDTIYQERK